MPLTDSEVKSAIRSRWDVSSQKYDTHYGHGIKTSREREAWKRILREALPGNCLNILDVGCGTGEISLVLAEMGHNILGVDISEKMLARAQAKAKASKLNAEFSIGDAESLNFDDGRFDAVVSRHLLWTLPHPDRAMNECKRVLKNNGTIIVIDGMWRDGSLEGRARRLASELGVFLLERQNPWKAWYPSELNSALPHRFGLSSEEARKYFEASSLCDVTLSDLNEIREIQKTGMPLHRRIAFNWTYYLVRGNKR
jgi:ubiquinone/menaquinone biosynthesis C-methylase UbiE